MTSALHQRWKRLTLWTKLSVFGSVASVIGVALYFVPSDTKNTMGESEQVPGLIASPGRDISSQKMENVSASESSSVQQVGTVADGGTVIGVQTLSENESPTRKRSVNHRLRDVLKATRPSLESFTRDARDAGKAISFGTAHSVSADIHGICEPLEESLDRLSKVIYEAKDAGIVDADCPSSAQLEDLRRLVVSMHASAKKLATLATQFEAVASNLQRVPDADRFHAQRETTIASMTATAKLFDERLPSVLATIDRLCGNDNNSNAQQGGQPETSE